MLLGPRRSRSADLAIRTASGDVLLAAEFKFEPDHARRDLLANKFPVTGWGDALKDIGRIEEFVSAGKVPVAYAVLIDEGRFYRTREAHPGSEWIDWKALRRMVARCRSCGHGGRVRDALANKPEHPPASNRQVGQLTLPRATSFADGCNRPLRPAPNMHTM
jgi:hypothetical protein